MSEPPPPDRSRLPPEERTGYRSGDPAFHEPPLEGGPGEDPIENAPTCDLCGASMIERHCKLTCTRCGYQRDCSDP